MSSSTGYSDILVPIDDKNEWNCDDADGVISISSSPPKFSLTNCNILKLPSREFDKAFFSTKNGFKEGYILSKKNHTYRVHFYRNENGDKINEIQTISTCYKIKPYRKNKDPIFIYIRKRLDGQISGYGFVRSQHPIDVGYGIGSGLNGRVDDDFLCEEDKYPIYTPLTFHSMAHRKTLTRASQTFIDIVTEYLQFEFISEKSLDRACWLINVVLYVDGFPSITSNAILEALTNFICDYVNFAPNTILRQPINYIFDVVNIDGVCCDQLKRDYKNYSSISFIPTDFKGVVYHVSDSKSDSH